MEEYRLETCEGSGWVYESCEGSWRVFISHVRASGVSRERRHWEEGGTNQGVSEGVYPSRCE